MQALDLDEGLHKSGCLCIGDMLTCPETDVLGDGHKNCAPLTNIMSAHSITMTYFNLMKVGKEETFGVSIDDGVFLGVLPCSYWMLGTRISSVTLTCSLVMVQFFSL